MTVAASVSISLLPALGQTFYHLNPNLRVVFPNSESYCEKLHFVFAPEERRRETIENSTSILQWFLLQKLVFSEAEESKLTFQ